MIKLNNKGWGLGAFFGIIVFLFFAIIITVIQANKLGIAGREQVLPVVLEDKPNEMVDSATNRILKATKKYVEDHFPNMQKNSPHVISYALLVEYGYLDPVIMNNELCTGYTVVTMEDKLKLKTYYSCPSTTSVGYNNELDSKY